MIKIIADTLSLISVKKAAELDIPLLPQIIIFGEESFRDDTEIDPATFLKRLRVAKELPKTAAPAPALYTPIFKRLIDNELIPFVVSPSAELSGTYRSAVVAAGDFPESEIHILDTGSLGAGLGVMVRQAVEWANQDIDVSKIKVGILEMAKRERIYFIVDTLEYLHRGGRIGGAKAFLGSVLQIKPILQLKNGKIEPADNQRTKKRALMHTYELVSSQCPRDEAAHLSIMHCGVENDAQELARSLGDLLGLSDIPIYHVPAAIAVHGGPGILGVSFFVSP